MAHVDIVNVTKRYGSVLAVDNLSLGIAPGERVTLLGPSGCGKTTTLNLIAGFLTPDTGAIHIGGRDVSAVPVHKRDIGMVFQSYALFPHLTVFDNVAFGLAMRKVAKDETARRVREALSIVRLQEHGDRYPRQLSGGQQQRVALARALVIRPDIMLLDEPLSNLDAKLRQQMRTELVEILDAVETTVIFVTHDQEEALALSDRVVVLNDGRIEQVGAATELYERPATAFVAKFLGESNVLPATVLRIEPGSVVCDVGGGLQVRSSATAGLAVGDAVEVIIRVERLHMSLTPVGLANSFAGVVEQSMYLGGNLRYGVRVGQHLLTVVDKNRGDGAVLNRSQALHLEWTDRDTFVIKVKSNGGEPRPGTGTPPR